MAARWATLDGTPTRIIAHRGASGPWPEHTWPAYAQALSDGADVLEPDLVITRDGHLVVRHDRGLARSTDVATRPEFVPRGLHGDWPVDTFERAELDALRAVQPFPQRDRRHDGQHALLDFAQLVAWAAEAGAARGTPLVLYPELKHPAAFAACGLDPVPRFIEEARVALELGVGVWFQCFEAEPLQRVRAALGVPVCQLVEAPCDWRALLPRLRGAVDALGADKRLLLDADGRDTGLVAEAHALGLQVHAWTYRDDVPSRPMQDVREELQAAFALGVDAVFCDFPATGAACRERWSPV